MLPFAKKNKCLNGGSLSRLSYAHDMKKPNILFIMTDQQRADAMGCSGGWVKTPNLDRIASEGIRFEQCVTTTPVCIPARLTMATGLYPHKHGVWDNAHYRISEDSKTWMQCIRDAGYRTSLFGKTHLHPHEGDLREEEDLMHALGIDDVNEIGGPRASTRVMSYMTAMWREKNKLADYRADFKDRFSNNPTVVRPSTLGLEDYSDNYVGEQAFHYLQQYNKEQPWFCWLSFGGPHEPWDTPKPYADLYNPDDMPPALHQKHMSKDMPNRYHKRKLDNDKDAAHIAEMRADYAGNITLIDEKIGKILNLLEERGELDNTIITFTSDHGEMNGDFGLVYKSVFMNGAVRVPMIVRTPATMKNGGAVCSSPCEWSDLGPTLVELADAQMDHQQHAKSMCPSINNPEIDFRSDAISEQFNECMLVTKEWKIIVGENDQPYALFDQINDPEELHNQVNNPAYAEIIQQLHKRVHERMQS